MSNNEQDKRLQSLIGTEAFLYKGKITIKTIRKVDDYYLAYFGENGIVNLSILKDSSGDFIWKD